MSQAPHPKSEDIKRALLEMRSIKEVENVVSVHRETIYQQIKTHNLRRIYLTKEERELIADRRGLDSKFVP